MGATKARPDRVDTAAAHEARSLALAEERHAGKARQVGWTKYILVRYRRTASLAPGCDARDFYAWWDATS